MGEGGAGMTDQYIIEIQRPLRARRGDLKLIVVVTDDQGKELFRDWADLSEEKIRNRVSERIANLTPVAGDDRNDRARQPGIEKANTSKFSESKPSSSVRESWAA